jgi:hypothetical protein
VSTAGNGSGNVSSNPAGIDCGADCTENYTTGTIVTLTASATTGSTFAGWSGAGASCPGLGDCTVTLSSAMSITATFTLDTHALSVNLSGSGGGAVSSSPIGINCGLDCGESYDYGTQVTLTATPNGTSTFIGWSGGGCSGTGQCIVDMTTMHSVTAQFDLIQYNLRVQPAGGGTGSVSSSPAGIDCGLDCDQDYDAGTMVTLTATPAVGSVFVAWSGDCTSVSNMCTVTMDSAKLVFPQFDLEQHLVTVNISPDNTTGSVVSNDTLINCGPDCTELYNYGTFVSLTATPATGYMFTGWTGGGCSGTGTCDFTVGAPVTVAANFAVLTHTLTVNQAGNGSGVVSSMPNGISCGLDCTEDYSDGTFVQLFASPSTGTNFDGWNGCDSIGGAGECIVTMNGAKNVTATFTLQTFVLNVTLSGLGVGEVLSNPLGISCGNGGTACSVSFDYGTMVQLFAQPEPGTSFGGFTGDCSGPACVLMMTANRSVNADFNVIPPNYVFVTSTMHDGKYDGMGLARADEICNERAAAANLPGTYVAWLSDSTADARDRLGSASGWIRTRDDRPVANTVDDIVTGHLLFPITFDEFGNFINHEPIRTGTGGDGRVFNQSGYTTCNDWTMGDSGQQSMAGYTSANSEMFTFMTSTNCASMHRHYCFGIDNQAVVSPLPGPTRNAFTTEAFWTPGLGISDADNLCRMEAQAAGLPSPATFKALLARAGSPAIARFNTSGPTWARVDKTRLVAVASDITDPNNIHASPNGNAANSAWYGNWAIWSGAINLTTPGTMGTTCQDWNANGGAATGRGGRAGITYVPWWLGLDMFPCNATYARLVCLED